MPRNKNTSKATSGRKSPSYSPSRAYTTASPKTPATVTTPQPSVAAQAQKKQPGLFAQMAATAGGVAVGSAVGHAVGAGISNIMGGKGPEAVQTQEVAARGNEFQACSIEIQQFLKCAEKNADDLNLCQGFMEVLKQCKASNIN